MSPHASCEPLDPALYNIEPEETKFLKAQTGIGSDEELKKHILAVQAKAYQIVPFGCIRLFTFIRSMITKMPAYQHVLTLGKERYCGIFLDLGCCFGLDSRRIAADGWPASNIVAVDLHQAFLDLGHDLFKSDPTTCPIHFLSGDLYNSEFLQARDIIYSSSSSATNLNSIPDLSTLTSLNTLHGQVSAIYIAAVFHLFDDEKQIPLARGLASLLSPLPGSTIFGWDLGSADRQAPEGFPDAICHSEESWTNFWTKTIFTERNSVKVTTMMVSVPNNAKSVLLWSVVRT